MLKAHPKDQMFLPLGKTPEHHWEGNTNIPMGTVNPIIRRLLQERADRERESGRNLAEGFNRHGSPPLPDLRVGHGEGRPIENMPSSTHMGQEPHSFEQFPPRDSPQAHLNRGMDPEQLKYLEPSTDTDADPFIPPHMRHKERENLYGVRGDKGNIEGNIDFSNPGF